MAEQVKIGLLYRTLEEVPEYQLRATREAFPDKEVVFETIHPNDPVEHNRLCQEVLQHAPVLLPFKVPTPQYAMQHTHHFYIDDNGQLLKLVGLAAYFEPVSGPDLLPKT